MKRLMKKLQPQLPSSFAQDLLQCEIDIKLSQLPAQQIIKKIISLYTLGVQFYQSIRSHKYLYFQIKLNELFKSPKLKSIEFQANRQIQIKTQSLQQEQKIKAIKIRQKHEQMLSQMIQFADPGSIMLKANQMIKTSQNKKDQLKERITENLSKQDKMFNEKLLKRQQKKKLKLYSSCGNLQNVFDSQQVQTIKKKPLEVSFSNLINEFDEDNKNESLSQQKVKKIKSLRAFESLLIT